MTVAANEETVASQARIGIRQVRVFLAVADRQSVTRAAKVLNRSQTCVTKSLRELECQLGETLFDRSSRGVTLTTFGKCLLARAREAESAFAAASDLVPLSDDPANTDTSRLCSMDISDRWLDAFVTAAEHHNVGAAAEQLGLTPTAVCASIRKLEDTLHARLFDRTPSAMTPTPFAANLVRCVKLARSHLRSACDEIANLRGANRGRLVIGTLPFVRTIIVPRAITALLNKHRALDVATVEGTYEDLVAGLRCGDIDIVIGALRGESPDSDLEEQFIFDASLSVIVRSGHPLLNRPECRWQDLLQYPWVLPRSGTPTRKHFEDAIHARGLQSPNHVVETSSLVMLRGLLLESDRLTVLSRHQVRFEEASGLLAALPFQLSGTRRPFGLTFRRNALLPPAAELFAAELRVAAAQCLGAPEPAVAPQRGAGVVELRPVGAISGTGAG